MMQARVGSSHLSPIGEPYKYPLEIYVSKDFWYDYHLPPSRRDNQIFLPSKVYPLECQGRSESHWAGDFGCTRPP